MEELRASKTTVTIYQCTRRNILENMHFSLPPFSLIGPNFDFKLRKNQTRNFNCQKTAERRAYSKMSPNTQIIHVLTKKKG